MFARHFSNSYLEMISILIDNNASHANLQKCERNINKSLVEQNTMLKLILQSLETYACEKAQVVRKQAELQSEAASPVNDSIVHMQATSSADKGKSDCISSVAKENFPANCSGSAHKEKSPTDCVEQSIRDQWKEIRIKKHNEFLYLKPKGKSAGIPEKNLLPISDSKRSTVTGEAVTTTAGVDNHKGLKGSKGKINKGVSKLLKENRKGKVRALERFCSLATLTADDSMEKRS